MIIQCLSILSVRRWEEMGEEENGKKEKTISGYSKNTKFLSLRWIFIYVKILTFSYIKTTTETSNGPSYPLLCIATPLWNFFPALLTRPAEGTPEVILAALLLKFGRRLELEPNIWLLGHCPITWQGLFMWSQTTYTTYTTYTMGG